MRQTGTRKVSQSVNFRERLTRLIARVEQDMEVFLSEQDESTYSLSWSLSMLYYLLDGVDLTDELEPALVDRITVIRAKETLLTASGYSFEDLPF